MRRVEKGCCSPRPLHCALLVLASCGGSDTEGRATLNLWVFNEPSGAFKDGGRPLQRRVGRSLQDHLQHAVQRRRPAAPVARPPPRRQGLEHRHRRHGRGVDRRVRARPAGSSRGPRRRPRRSSRGTLAGPLATATYKGRLWAAPANTNTQLLWYRKDLVKNPAKTWDGLITQAVALPKAGRIEIQGAQYEGTTVWFNSLVAVRRRHDRRGQPRHARADRRHGGADHEAARDVQGRRPGHLGPEGGPEPARVRVRRSAAFEVNYPFIYPSAKDGAPEIFKNLAWAPYPSVKPGGPDKAPIGGINWGVGGYTKHPAEAFAGRGVPAQRPEPEAGGDQRRPAADADVALQRPVAAEGLPVRQADPRSRWTPAPSVRSRRPTPTCRSPIYKSVSPPSRIELNNFVPDLRAKLNDALDSKGLF